MEFEQVYDLYFRDVYRYILKLSGSEHVSEEITSDTFFKALRSIGKFRGSCDMRVWLCQIAKHLWYQHLRKANRETELPEEAELPLMPSAEDEAISRSGQLDMLRRVHELPEPGREVVYLRAFGGLSFREIGDVLCKTETWARVTFYRGKERLKQGGCNDEK